MTRSLLEELKALSERLDRMAEFFYGLHNYKCPLPPQASCEIGDELRDMLAGLCAAKQQYKEKATT